MLVPCFPANASHDFSAECRFQRIAFRTRTHFSVQVVDIGSTHPIRFLPQFFTLLWRQTMSDSVNANVSHLSNAQKRDGEVTLELVPVKPGGITYADIPPDYGYLAQSDLKDHTSKILAHVANHQAEIEEWRALAAAAPEAISRSKGGMFDDERAQKTWADVSDYLEAVATSTKSLQVFAHENTRIYDQRSRGDVLSYELEEVAGTLLMLESSNQPWYEELGRVDGLGTKEDRRALVARQAERQREVKRLVEVVSVEELEYVFREVRRDAQGSNATADESKKP
jgi:hypothetical protein